MAVANSAVYAEIIGGVSRKLLLRNGEIERFEVQYAPFGLFQLLDQLVGRGAEAQVRHVRDIVALGLIGAGMSDRSADELIAGLPPSENIHLRNIAKILMVRTFMPPDAAIKKKVAGSGESQSTPTPAMTPPPAS